jgi:ABC-2 type transport system ATP-binding protein
LPTGNAVTVEQLTKIYHAGQHNEIRALQGISFQVRRGEIFGLLGENGAGKTTLVSILTTLTLPTSGRAEVMGYDVVRQSLAVRRSIAVVLQQFAVELYLSVRDNLITFAKFQGYPLSESRRRAGEILEKFHLEDHADDKAQDLSIGTRRRLQVAKMFMVDSPLLFLDEPAVGMDPLVKREFLATVREHATAGKTIFLTTQVLSEAEELCDRVLIMDGGKIAAEGDIASLKLMSRGVYNVVLSFEAVTDELLDEIKRSNPTRLEVKQNTVKMTLRSSEPDVLKWLGVLSQRWSVLSFEVSGASLEDVFLDVLAKSGANGQRDRRKI